ncbi:hypothetical protein [uncultured Bacteroides sp.]|uniref:hypothetical protein n=1 Tax=uncultured Bacteroides sp. TaxID=162156 RepID=UPI00262E0DC4|nr:hypothetical protein [uncultured Bacteroides sp.]
MTKTIEEEIYNYAKMCSLDEAGYVAIQKAIQFGIKLHESLPPLAEAHGRGKGEDESEAQCLQNRPNRVRLLGL